jgi:hypothetical protein
MFVVPELCRGPIPNAGVSGVLGSGRHGDVNGEVLTKRMGGGPVAGVCGSRKFVD